MAAHSRLDQGETASILLAFLCVSLTTGLAVRLSSRSEVKAVHSRSPGGGGSHASIVPSISLMRTLRRSGILRSHQGHLVVCRANETGRFDDCRMLLHRSNALCCFEMIYSLSTAKLCITSCTNKQITQQEQGCRSRGMLGMKIATAYVRTHWEMDLAAESAMRRICEAAALRRPPMPSSLRRAVLLRASAGASMIGGTSSAQF